jgi:hypothetical protein
MKNRIVIIAACAGALLALATADRTYANYVGVETTRAAGGVGAAPAIRLAVQVTDSRSNIRHQGIMAGSTTGNQLPSSKTMAGNTGPKSVILRSEGLTELVPDQRKRQDKSSKTR